MFSTILAGFYERDLRRFIDEINLFQNEDNLWLTTGSVRNSAGNLALHIIGGLNYLIGTNLAHTTYVRHRDEEFSKKGVRRQEMVMELEKLILLIKTTLNAFGPGQMEAEYPIPFDGSKNPSAYVLTTLLAHLNYHLGQVNYLRRILE
jgi:hypothetical protein